MQAATRAVTQAPAALSDVHCEAEEKLKVLLNRDGGVQNIEVFEHMIAYYLLYRLMVLSH